MAKAKTEAQASIREPALGDIVVVRECTPGWEPKEFAAIVTGLRGRPDVINATLFSVERDPQRVQDIWHAQSPQAPASGLTWCWRDGALPMHWPAPEPQPAPPSDMTEILPTQDITFSYGSSVMILRKDVLALVNPEQLKVLRSIGSPFTTNAKAIRAAKWPSAE
jgi:hypothetical protein